MKKSARRATAIERANLVFMVRDYSRSSMSEPISSERVDRGRVPGGKGCGLASRGEGKHWSQTQRRYRICKILPKIFISAVFAKAGGAPSCFDLRPVANAEA